MADKTVLAGVAGERAGTRAPDDSKRNAVQQFVVLRGNVGVLESDLWSCCSRLLTGCALLLA